MTEFEAFEATGTRLRKKGKKKRSNEALAMGGFKFGLPWRQNLPIRAAPASNEQLVTDFK